MASLLLSNWWSTLVLGLINFRRAFSSGSLPSSPCTYGTAPTCRDVAGKVGSTLIVSVQFQIKTFQQQRSLKRSGGSSPCAVVALWVIEVRARCSCVYHVSPTILFYVYFLRQSPPLFSFVYIYAYTYCSTHNLFYLNHFLFLIFSCLGHWIWSSPHYSLSLSKYISLLNTAHGRGQVILLLFWATETGPLLGVVSLNRHVELNFLKADMQR
jgi:hypothetical protein